MVSLIKETINVGVNDDQSQFDQRRIRIVNVFCLIAAFLIFLFGTLNLTIGATTQALIIYSGIILLVIPPIYLNKIGKPEIARIYFVCVGLLLADFATFRAVLNFQNRHNEVFLVGYSTIIVVLLDNPAKVIFLMLTVLSTLVMITLRQFLIDLPITNDTIMAYANTLVAFGCIYFFINIFKQEQLKSVAAIRTYSEQLERKGKEIEKQRDEISGSRKLIRASIDSIPIFISLMDMNGDYLIANSHHQKMLGMPVSDIEGKNYRKILPSYILKSQGVKIERALSGEIQEFDQLTKVPNGTKIHAFGKYIPIYDSNQKQFGIAVYVVDISEQKKVEAELKLLNETKNRLLSIISHDIREPINSLKGLMSVKEGMSVEEREKFNLKLNAHLDKVSFSVDNLLNWAKTQMEGFSSNPSAVGVKEVIEDCIHLFEENAKEKEVEIINEVKTNSTVWIDQQNLKLVLRNLLSNAIKFSPLQGEIRITENESESEMIISIIDFGSGMTREQIDELNMGAKSITSKVGTAGEIGTGLGLSLSIEILKLNNARLKLSNNPKGGNIAEVILMKNQNGKNT